MRQYLGEIKLKAILKDHVKFFHFFCAVTCSKSFQNGDNCAYTVIAGDGLPDKYRP